MKRSLVTAAFAVYCAVMVWLLFGQRLELHTWESYRVQLWENLNLKIFDTVWRYFWVLGNSEDPEALRHAVINLAGNVVMFVPMGALLPGVFPKLRSPGWFWLYAVSAIIGIELSQLVTLLGSCDVDDLILNLAGIAVGWCIWLLASKLNRKHQKGSA